MLNNAKTYSEIYEILNILGIEFIKRIPKKMYNLFDLERDKKYKPNLFKEDGMFDETKISKETIALFAVLNVKYFMNDEEQKNEFYRILNENEKKYQEELREKYNPDDLFKNKIQQQSIKENTNVNEVAIIERKESLLKRVFNKIKRFFKKENY